MTQQKKIVKRKSIGDYFHLLSVPAGMLLLALVLIDICGRLFFGKNLAFGLTLEELLLMVIGFISLGATWKAGQFINVDFFVNRFSKRVQLVLSVFAILVSLVSTGILMWFGIEATLRAFAGGARPTNMNMPIGIWKLVIPVALGGLLVEIITSLVLKIKELISEEARVMN
jgi:TRAP-type C4-dicarboxylate transport system permease small subunit